MIQLYDADQTDFSHNGHVLQDVYNDTVTWQLNAKFELKFDYPLFSRFGFDLIEEKIITVPTPSTFDHDQAFRIDDVTTSMGVVTVHAYHVFWDLLQNFVEDTNVVAKSGSDALEQILSRTQFQHNFTVTSNLANVSTARLVRKSVIDALIGTDDNSFLSRWGGEFEWDNWHFNVTDKIGLDRGVIFRNKKNLTGYTAEKAIGNVVTRIMPEGYNGLLLPEKYVDSPLIDNYQTPRVAVIQYQDIKAIDENTASGDDGAVPVEEAYEQLRTAAKAEFTKNKLDEPSTTYKLNVLLLENTEEYQGKGQFNKVYPGDTATFIHDEDKMNAKAELTAYTWSPVQSEYLTITFESITKSSPDIRQTISRVANQVTAIDKNVVLIAANGKNANTWSTKAPVDGVDIGVEGDLWYQQDGGKTIMWHYENGHWTVGASDLTGKEIREKVDKAFEDIPSLQKKVAANDDAIEENLTKTDAAIAAANQAVADTFNNSNQITQIKSDMAIAVTQANAANVSATTALGNAATALSTAKTASDDASTAIANAATAINAATDAQAKTNTLVTKVDDINNTIETLATTETVDKLAGTVTTVQNLAQFASDGLKLKADVTTVDTLNQTVTKQGSQLALTATKAELQVAQTSVDNLKKTVTSNTAGMTANANALKLKADSSTVSTLDGRVTNLSGQLDVQANLISAKVTANDVTGMLGNYATQSWSEGKISAAKNEISTSVTTVNQRIDNLQIGVQNLIPYSEGIATDAVYWDRSTKVIAINIDSGPAFALDGTATTSGSSRTFGNLRKELVPQLKSATRYYVSFEYKVEADSLPATLSTNFALRTTTSDGGYKDNGLTIADKSVIGRWYKQSGFVVTPSDVVETTQASVNLGFNGRIVFRKLLFAETNTPINWVRSLSDYATVDWMQSQLLVADKKIEASVTSLNSNIATATKDMATQTWTQGKLSVTESSFSAQVSSIQGDLNTKYTSLQGNLQGLQATVNNAATKAQVTVLSNQMTSVISDATNQEYNLVVNAGLKTNMEGWNVIGNGITSFLEATHHTVVIKKEHDITGSHLRINLIKPVTTNATYTIVVKFKSVNRHFTLNIGGVDGFIFKLPLQDGVQKATISGSGKDIDINQLFISSSWLQVGDRFEIEWIKLIAGADADLNFYPAVEYASTTSVSSQITQLRDDINLRVKTGDFASAVLNINNMISARVTNDDFITAVLGINDSINMRVYNSSVGNLLRNSEFVNEKYWTQTGNHVFMGIDAKQSMYDGGMLWITSTGAGSATGCITTEFKADNLIKGDDLTLSFYVVGTAGTVLRFSIPGTSKQLSVTLTATRTYHTLQFTYDSGNQLKIYADRADSQIFVDSLMMVMGTEAMPWRPATDNLMSRIYMDESDVLIQGEHIHINGATTIDSAVIKSAMIDTVSANKLTAGTIDGYEINVVHVNGQNITANSITADKLAADAVQIGLNNLGSVIRINPASLDFYNGGQRSMSLQKDGMHIIDYLNGEDVGLIHVNRMEGHDNVNGLQFDLNKNGDYMAWGQRSDDTSLYSVKLGWFSSYAASQTNFVRGVNIVDDLTIDQHYTAYLTKIGTNYDEHRYIQFSNTNVDDIPGVLIGSTSGHGILIGDDAIFLVFGGGVYNMWDVIHSIGTGRTW